MSQATRILLSLVLGLVGGIAIAAFAPGAVDPVAEVAQPIGTAWLNGLQMTIVPLVVSLLVTGIAATAEAAARGGFAGRAIGLYLVMMTSSAVLASLLTPLLLDLAPIPANRRKACARRCRTSAPYRPRRSWATSSPRWCPPMS
ncbi:cation:dicarboxylate symporter family transporter [Sphingomonas sp. MMS24-JH45]